MAEHLVTEDSDTGYTPATEDGHRRVRVWVGLDLAEMALVRRNPSHLQQQLLGQFPGASALVIHEGSVVVVDYIDGHPFGDTPLVRPHDDPAMRDVAVVGDLCAARVTEFLNG